MGHHSKFWLITVLSLFNFLVTNAIINSCEFLAMSFTWELREKMILSPINYGFEILPSTFHMGTFGSWLLKALVLMWFC